MHLLAIMRAIILANKQSLFKINGKTLLQRNIEIFRKRGFEVAVYPAKYKKYAPNVKMIRSLKDLKEDALIIKGNAWIKNFEMKGNYFIGKDGSLIGYIGKDKFKGKKEIVEIEAVEIKSEEDLKKVKNFYRWKIDEFLKSTYLTPQQLSVASFLLAIIAFLFYLPKEYTFIFIGSIIILFVALMDNWEEKLKKLKKEENDLDFTLDTFADVAIISGLTIFAYSRHTIAWLLGISALSLATILKAYGNCFHRQWFLVAIAIGSLLFIPNITLVALLILILAWLIKCLKE